MTGGDQQKSLWTSSRAHPPKRHDDVPRPVRDRTTAQPPGSNAQHETHRAGLRAHLRLRLHDVIVRWKRDEPEASAPRANAQQPVRRRAVALGVLAAIVMVALAAALPGRGFQRVVVPSYWDDVTTSCDTARFEHGKGALELFRCHAVDGGRLPPGVYRSPNAQWRSDITRREARANEIEISPDGELTGWAMY
jgi:hypothetical protein